MPRPLHALTITVLLLQALTVRAQNLLDKRINIDVSKRRVEDVLEVIGKRAGFSFTYNSNIIPRDSLVTLSSTATPARQLLQSMFGERYQYKELDKHIVILPAETEKWFTISGHISDAVTGQKIEHASIIETQGLYSTLSDQDGYFRLRIKDKGKYALEEVKISKGTFYTDTMLNLFPGYDQEITIALAPASYNMPDIVVTQYGMEHSWFGKFLISSKLRQQSANLGKFFVDKPVQASIIPGIGTHGKLSSQVTNKFSFNLLGGYTAGVEGFELGGLFNIDKKDVKYAQVGGVFNIVSGSVKGAQIGGVFNNVSGSVRGGEVGGIGNIVKDSTTGVQIAGIFNRTGGHVKGAQIAGIINLQDRKDTSGTSTADTFYEIKGAQVAGIANVVNNDVRGAQVAGIINIVSKSARGVQVAGIVNLVNEDVRGAQLSGIGNVAHRSMKGVQVSGIFNIAGRIEGSQVGLINIADTITGYGIGLVNVVRKGYHAIALSANDLTDVTLSYKTGTKRLYNIIMAGTKINGGKMDFLYGFGLGTEKAVSKHIGISLECMAGDLYKYNLDANALIIRVEPAFNWNITRKFTLYTGPSLSIIPYVFYGEGNNTTSYDITHTALHNFNTGQNTATWLGWQVGLHLF